MDGILIYFLIFLYICEWIIMKIKIMLNLNN